MRNNGLKNNGKIAKSKSKWIKPYPEYPADQLKIKMLLDEKISGNRVIVLEAKIEPSKIHKLHIHENEYVIVYSLKGRCKVTIGDKTVNVSPKTIMYIPPKVPHRFENNTKKNWKGIAFAVGSKKNIKNLWLEE